MYSPSIDHRVIRLLQRCYSKQFCQASRLNKQCRQFSGRPAIHRSGTRPSRLTRPIRSNGDTRKLESQYRTLHNTAVLSQNPTDKDKTGEIAVLGGGITGLSTAYYLAKDFPRARITIYEGSERLGGWMRSTPVEVEGGTIYFESGPRTLRGGGLGSPANLNFYELLFDLNLEEQVLFTRRDSESAQNRYIYYPDKLVRLPTPGRGVDIWQRLWTFFTEPVFAGLLSAGFREFRTPRRALDVKDESLGDFMTRRTGDSRLADNLTSAVLHGIYAGDVYQLSVKSIAPKLWWLEGSFGSFIGGFLSRLHENIDWLTERDEKFILYLKRNRAIPQDSPFWIASVFTFKQGIGQFATTLEQHLRANKNVFFKSNTMVKSLKYDEQRDGVQVATLNNQPSKIYDTVISTISAKRLASLAPEQSLPSLASQHAVTVMTVNLYYSDPFLLPERGFGYLIPRSIAYDQNPECALGVVFDSESAVGQDTAKGTKLTVMLGGHWWDHLASTNSYPTEEEGLEMAKAVLKRHLKIDQEPEAYRINLSKDCIPQYTVGHDARMQSASTELETTFRGRVRVAGSSYTGVSVYDCVRSAREVVNGLEQDSSPWTTTRTGLEHFGRENDNWIPIRIKK